MAYPAFDRPPMLAHRQSFHGPRQIGYSPYDDVREGYDDIGPYPYGEPLRGMYDEPMSGALGLYGDVCPAVSESYIAMANHKYDIELCTAWIPIVRGTHAVRRRRM